MKKLLIVIVLGFAVAATQSCKKPPLPVVEEETTNGGNGSGGGNNGGGEEEEEKPNPYVGTWDYTKIDLTNGTLGFMGNDAGTFKGTGSDIKGKVVISENPNKYTTEVEFTADIEAMVFGQIQEQEAPVGKQTSSGTWTESNGEITLTDDKGTDISVISSSSSKVLFEGNFTTDIPINQFVTLTANSDVVFTIEK